MSVRYPSNTLSPYTVRIRKVIKLANAIAIDYWNGDRDFGRSTWCSMDGDKISVDYQSYGDDHEMHISIEDETVSVFFNSKNMQIDTALTDKVCDEEFKESADIDEWVALIEGKITQIQGDNGETILNIYNDTAPFEDNEEYMLNGSYRNMVYISPVISNGKETANELTALYRKHYESLESFVFKVLRDTEVLNAYLVITPSSCDNKNNHGFEVPHPSDNYIVKPFDKTSIELIEKLKIPSEITTDNNIEAYVALEINDKAPDYDDCLSEGVDSDEHVSRMFSLSLQLGSWAAEEDGLPVTTYFEIAPEGFVEQGYDVNSEKHVNGYNTIEGFYSEYESDDYLENYDSYDKYRVSKSNAISKCLLTKEELIKKAGEFSKNPWTVGSVPTEQSCANSIEYPTQFESDFPVYILKTAKLAAILADDWRNSNEDDGIFENKWVPEKIKVSVNQYAENNKDIYTLVIKANEYQVELWFKDEDAELDIEYLFEEFPTIDSKNEALDMSEANLNKWIVQVENIILDDMSRKEIQKKIYSDNMLMMNGIEKDTNDVPQKVSKKKAKKKVKKEVDKS